LVVIKRQSSGVPLFGSASFHVGDMCSVFKSPVGQKVSKSNPFCQQPAPHMNGKLRSTVEVRSCSELAPAFDEMRERDVDGVVVAQDGLFFVARMGL
jgi:hypothetical protein